MFFYDALDDIAVFLEIEALFACLYNMVRETAFVNTKHRLVSV